LKTAADLPLMPNPKPKLEFPPRGQLMRLFAGSMLSPLYASIRKILKLAAIFGSLAPCLCYAGEVSAGPSVTIDTTFHSTFGHPSMALVTADDNYVLVSLACDVAKNQLECAPATPPAPPNQAGVQVFDSDFNNPCGGQNIIGFPPPAGQAVTSVDGMQFLSAPQGVSVGAAVEQQGAEFFNLSDVETCAIDGARNIINVQQRPVQPPMSCTAQGGLCYPGSFDIALTPNGSPGYAFVANEYGLKRLPPPKVNFGLGGTVGIIRIKRNPSGGFTPKTRSIEQNHTIYIPGADTIPGVTMSHDGKRLYVANENARQNEINKKTGNPYWDPTNVTNTPNGAILASQNCQPGGSDKSTGNLIEHQNNGLLTIVDVDKAKRGGGQSSILVSIASGCSPVRVVETADGKYIWVAARGLNKNLPVQPGASGYQVLAFDVSKLLSKSLNDVNDALVGFGDSGGTAPVGLALFDNDQMLAVANSNRFFALLTPPAGATNVAILDVSNPQTPTVITTIPPTPTPADMFPRDVTIGPTNVGDCLADSGCFTLYVPNYDANSLEVIKAHVN
jgi:hypothetical protein